MIDEQTGEVRDLVSLDEEQQDYLPITEGIAHFVSAQRLPIHMVKLPKGVTPEQSLQSMRMFSDYVETPTISLKDRVGSVITVIGAIIYEQGPYVSFKDQKMSPGYYEVRLKLAETEVKKLIVGDEVRIFERNIIARSSGKRVGELIVGLVDQLGWYDWDCALEFEVALDGKNGAMYLRMI